MVGWYIMFCNEITFQCWRTIKFQVTWQVVAPSSWLYFFSHVFYDLGSLLYPVCLGMQRVLKRPHFFQHSFRCLLFIIWTIHPTSITQYEYRGVCYMCVPSSIITPYPYSHPKQSHLKNWWKILDFFGPPYQNEVMGFFSEAIRV